VVKKQIPDLVKARGITKEQVIKDVLLAAQPTKQFVTVGLLRCASSWPPTTRPARSINSRRAAMSADDLDKALRSEAAQRLAGQ
jgi:hypothetical protein